MVCSIGDGTAEKPIPSVRAEVFDIPNVTVSAKRRQILVDKLAAEL